MDSDKFELILVPAKDDAPPFGAEYQAELRAFSREAHASGQRGMAMDSAVGGGGPLGEFIFNHGDALITALTTVAVTWLRGRAGRKLRLKVDGVVIDANTPEQIEAMAKQVPALQAAVLEKKKKGPKS